MYMYAGMADVAALGGYPEYVKAIDRLWDDVVGRKMYVTGGVGSRSGTEGFGDPYELPNRTAYTETAPRSATPSGSSGSSFSTASRNTPTSWSGSCTTA